MELYYHKRFKKQYHNLTPRLQQKVERAIQNFRKNPRDPHLRNHALHGDLENRRSISVTGDVRILFREENNYEIVNLLAVGTHNQVY